MFQLSGVHFKFIGSEEWGLQGFMLLVRIRKEVLRLPCSRFPSSTIIIRVPFFLLFGFNNGNPKRKRVKGYYWGT